MYIYQKINFSRFSFWLLIIDWNMLKEIVIRDWSERQKGRYFSKSLGSIPYWGATLVPMRNLSIFCDYFLQFYYWKIAVNATQKYCLMVSNYWELMLNHWNRVQSVAPWLSFQSEVLSPNVVSFRRHIAILLWTHVTQHFKQLFFLK